MKRIKTVSAKLPDGFDTQVDIFRQCVHNGEEFI